MVLVLPRAPSDTHFSTRNQLFYVIMPDRSDSSVELSDSKVWSQATMLVNRNTFKNESSLKSISHIQFQSAFIRGTDGMLSPSQKRKRKQDTHIIYYWAFFLNSSPLAYFKTSIILVLFISPTFSTECSSFSRPAIHNTWYEFKRPNIQNKLWYPPTLRLLNLQLLNTRLWLFQRKELSRGV